MRLYNQMESEAAKLSEGFWGSGENFYMYIYLLFEVLQAAVAHTNNLQAGLQ
jgi:hypothetical protein